MDPYQLLAQEIIVVFLKDYRRADPDQRDQLCGWPRAEDSCVAFCACALGMSAQQLVAGVLRQQQEIDKHHQL